MVKLFVDTCVWLDLSKTTKGEVVLDVLEEFMEQEDMDLIVPEIIVAEFERNKERVVSDAGRSLSSHFKKVKEMVREHGDEVVRDTVLSQLNDIDHKIPQLGENAVLSVKRISELLERAEKMVVTDEIILRAAQRALDKRAPFHLSKNSMGDAVLIEAFSAYKVQNKVQDLRLIFVTHNTKDFSSKTGNRKLPHEDFATIFDSPKTQYFVQLPEALHAINTTLMEEIEFDNDWIMEPRSFTEIMEAEEEFGEIIWYNRHQVRAEMIRKGTLKLIDKMEFKMDTANRTIVREIWEDAVKAAKAVEEKYGMENLYFDDFGWGMLNGKLSALRWTMGSEWGNLDT